MKVKPTQPELDNLKKREKFFRKGKNLLEIKRQQLYTILKELLQKNFDTHKDLKQKMRESYQLLKKTYEEMGKRKINIIARLNEKHYHNKLSINYYNRIGVDTPRINLEIKKSEYPYYDFIDTPILIDILVNQMTQNIQELIKFAEINHDLYNFGLNHQKIERRINALDSHILPKLGEDIQAIEDILDDNAMDEFIRMKKIKESLEEEE
jgi:V/A-type H+/Na+-transporting ATPase subunit D